MVLYRVCYLNSKATGRGLPGLTCKAFMAGSRDRGEGPQAADVADLYPLPYRSPFIRPRGVNNDDHEPLAQDRGNRAYEGNWRRQPEDNLYFYIGGHHSGPCRRFHRLCLVPWSVTVYRD